MFGDVRDAWVYLVALDPDPARATALDRTLAYAPEPYQAGDRVALEPMRFPGQPVPCMKVASLLAASPPKPAPSGLSDAFLADLRARLIERYGSGS
jgi:hypothetical protein